MKSIPEAWRSLLKPDIWIFTDGVSGWMWYLPHHNVDNMRKSSTFRRVFDCSAQVYPSTSKYIKAGSYKPIARSVTAAREQPDVVMVDIEAM